MRQPRLNFRQSKTMTRKLRIVSIKILSLVQQDLRGVIGAGTNRMNIYTVRKATQGLANYILKVNAQDKGVAIAFDSRHMSPEFADESALCLAANGIKAYVFESLRPTPELSYAVRKLGCTAGINITASHNPPEYNGYKVYWEDGAQITPPHDTGIMDEVKKVTDYSTVKTMSYEVPGQQAFMRLSARQSEDAYIAELKKLVVHQDAIDAVGKDLKDCIHTITWNRKYPGSAVC